MSLASPLRLLPRVTAALVPLLLAACPKPEPPGPEALTADLDDTESMGTSDPGGATLSPTTGASPSDTDDGTTAGTAETTGGTTGQDPSSSSGDTTGTTDPNFGQCPYEPPGVEAALERVDQGVPSDLSARPCGTAEDFAALAVIAADAGHLEASVCADATCGACDPAHTLTLSLTLPEPFEGLPAQLGPGDCVQLAAAWDRPGPAPDTCTLSSLALVRNSDGAPEPLPTFLYRYTETLPVTDVLGPFALTGALVGPGAITCPCQDDCCLDPPGSRRLRFIAQLWKAVIEVPPIESGDVVPAFAFATPEGDELLGTLALVRAYAPGTCDAPARHEWTLRVTPG